MITALERFRQICRFERLDDPMVWGVPAWNETLERWLSEGMPVDHLENTRQVNLLLMGYQDQKEMIRPWGAVTGMGRNGNPPWIAGVDPMFERQIIADDGEHITLVDYDGTIVQRRKEHDDSIAHYLEYPVKDRTTWREYKKRLDPFSPGRWPTGWQIMTQGTLGYPIRPGQEGKTWEERDFPLGMNLLSLYGAPRNYMGLEHISVALYDDPLLVEEMVEWQAYLAYEMARRVFESGISIDWVWLWEDIAANHGSLVSPRWVKRVMAPHYRKVVDLLLDHGVSCLILDCDGNVDELLPIWVDCGINATFPLECAAGMDGRQIRKRFGQNLIIIGNVDKRALARSKSAIDSEIAKVKELLHSGGFFPSVDHHVPPDVPYENMVYFLNEVRKLSAYPETRFVVPMPKPNELS